MWGWIRAVLGEALGTFLFLTLGSLTIKSLSPSNPPISWVRYFLCLLLLLLLLVIVVIVVDVTLWSISPSNPPPVCVWFLLCCCYLFACLPRVLRIASQTSLLVEELFSIQLSPSPLLLCARYFQFFLFISFCQVFPFLHSFLWLLLLLYTFALVLSCGWFLVLF